MISRLRPTFWLLCVLVTPWGIVSAQKGDAQLVGTVVDRTTGAIVPHADIVQLGVGRVVVSDSLGNYLFPDLPSGILRFLFQVPYFALAFRRFAEHNCSTDIR